MPGSIGRFGLGALVLLAACGSDHGLHRSAELLNNRLQERLGPDIASGSAAVQPLPDGAQVTLLGPGSFPNDVDTRTDRYREVRASVIEGLLDPALVRIAVGDNSALTEEQRAERVRNVEGYFRDNGLGLTLVPEGSLGSATGQGLTITIRLDCPAHRQPDNWNYAPPIPSCH
jgi:hypothetical protein